MNVVVAGGGIIGAAISNALAKKGCKVTVYERDHPAAGATGKSWAWLNALKKNPQHYRDLNLKGLEEWKSAFPNLTHACGSLIIDDGRPFQDPAYPYETLAPAQVLQLEPHLAHEIAQRRVDLYAQEAWCDPVASTRFLLDEALELGATVCLGEAVEKLVLEQHSLGNSNGDAHHGGGHTHVSNSADGGRVKGVLTSRGTYQPADVVVLACGVEIPPLAKQAGAHIPLLHRPAVMAVTKPLRPKLLQHLLITKDVFLWQKPNGCFLLSEVTPEPGTEADTSPAVGQHLLQLAAAVLPALKEAAIDTIQVGYRPYPADGHPIVGFCGAKNLYVAVTHSGMTLGAYLGRLIAEEVAEGTPLPDLAPYRPSRDFNSPAPAYGWFDAKEEHA